MRAHRLTDLGLSQLHGELYEIKAGGRQALSAELMTEGLLAEQLSTYNWDPPPYRNRLELATDVDELLRQAHLMDSVGDPGFWGWLTVVLFEQLCPQAKDGSRPSLSTPTAIKRYYPSLGEYSRYYRHLVAGPWLIYNAHRDDIRRAMPLLAGPIDKPGEVVEQLASRQEIVSNVAMMEVVARLYYDSSARVLKRGASRKTKGGVRRFAAVLGQFDVTYDLFSVDPSKFIALLPREFDDFKEQGTPE